MHYINRTNDTISCDIDLDNVTPRIFRARDGTVHAELNIGTQVEGGYNSADRLDARVSDALTPSELLLYVALSIKLRDHLIALKYDPDP